MANDAKVYDAWTGEWRPAKADDKEAVAAHEALIAEHNPPKAPPSAGNVDDEGPVATTASVGSADAVPTDTGVVGARGRNAG